MKKILTYLYLLLTVFLFSCKSSPTSSSLRTVAVTAITVERQTVPAVFEYVAVAQSSHLVEIRARVEGYLDKIAYKEGEMVKEGDFLFQIDPKPFQAQLAQSKAALAHQQAALWEATRSVDRFTPLYEQKAASQRDLDNATASKLEAQAAVEGAEASVIQAEINLGYTTIHSPISGLTNQANYREGSLVGPTSGQSLLTTVYTLDPIWVNFNVSEGDILKHHMEEKKGALKFPENMDFEIEVVLSNGTILPTKGKVDFADPALQENTGSMSVRAVMANPKMALRPGQFVRARLKGAVYPEAIVVPQQAVLQGKNGLYVLVVDKNGKAAMQPVDAGDWVGDDWVIKSGLEAGDQVIVEGTNKLMPGMPVAPEPYIKKQTAKK